MAKMAHTKPILCVFGALFYSSGDALNTQTKQGKHAKAAKIMQTECLNCIIFCDFSLLGRG
jgi:hypothetical protein